MSKIESIKAREILDSKGNPIIEVDLVTDLGLFHASAPSGVSTGDYEAIELRDGGRRYNGKGVLKAVENVNKIISSALLGKDPVQQRKIDEIMIELDGTANKSNLGANAILPVSIAVCRAGARAEKLPLWEYISQISGINRESGAPGRISLPKPCLLMMEGGVHAGNSLSTQEFMIVPPPDTEQTDDKPLFREELRAGVEIYQGLKALIEKEYGKMATNVGLEGGFSVPNIKTPTALELILKVIEQDAYRSRVGIILDVAAVCFFKDNIYQFEDTAFTRKDLMKFYAGLVQQYPVKGIEDPFSQDDWQGFEAITKKLGNDIFIIGDDLLATNKERIKKASERGAVNAIILKPNQVGTLSQTIEAAKMAYVAGWEAFVKHRGGETNDDFIADLAVGINAGYIMAGAPARGERVAKYNRLLRIEEELLKS